MLPVSLFGMSVSAAELPEMSRALGDHGVSAPPARMRACGRSHSSSCPPRWRFSRSATSSRRLLFADRPLHAQDARYVWGILAGSAVGLLASTLGRLYSSTYYALRDTRTPLRFAMIRVVLTTGLGYLFAIPLPKALGHRSAMGRCRPDRVRRNRRVGRVRPAAALANRRIGMTGLPVRLTARLWTSAAIAAAVGWGVKLAIGTRGPIAGAVLILGAYGVVYFTLTYAFGIPECVRLLNRVLRRA